MLEENFKSGTLWKYNMQGKQKLHVWARGI